MSNMKEFIHFSEWAKLVNNGMTKGNAAKKVGGHLGNFCNVQRMIALDTSQKYNKSLIKLAQSLPMIKSGPRSEYKLKEAKHKATFTWTQEKSDNVTKKYIREVLFDRIKGIFSPEDKTVCQMLPSHLYNPKDDSFLETKLINYFDSVNIQCYEYNAKASLVLFNTLKGVKGFTVQNLDINDVSPEGVNIIWDDYFCGLNDSMISRMMSVVEHKVDFYAVTLGSRSKNGSTFSSAHQEINKIFKGYKQVFLTSYSEKTSMHTIAYVKK